MCVYIYVCCKYINMCVCIYIYLCIYKHIYIFLTHIQYIYKQTVTFERVCAPTNLCAKTLSGMSPDVYTARIWDNFCYIHVYS